MNSLFGEIGLDKAIVEGLEKAGITVPTDIQTKTIPLALKNKDVIGESQTGSGKTLAYLLPLFQKIDDSKREMQAIILAPTHELAMQIYREVEILSKNSEMAVTSTVIMGDVNISRQVEKLREKPHIIVGSTGRILQLIKMKKIAAHTVKTIVVDEADRLLDKNNLEGVKAVIKTTLKERQILMFSATISNKTEKIAAELMKDLEIIRVGEDNADNNTVHYYFQCEQRDKIEILRKLLSALKPEKAIVFINKSDEVQITVAKLKYNKVNAEGLHGSNNKEDRQRALENFRLGKLNVLVASDIAARGLDIKGVTHVFNLDIPEKAEDYIHRAGRTGRAGEQGKVLSIATERELGLIKSYEKAYGIEITQKNIYKGEIVDIKRRKNYNVTK